MACPSPPLPFPGNPDIYGIGIRVGIYAQALAAWLANYFVASQARALRPANLLYMVALSITTLIFVSAGPAKSGSAGGGAVQSPTEIFLVLTILVFLGYLTVADAQPRYTARYLATGNLSYTLSSRLLGLFVAGFGIWFWANGVDVFEVQVKGEESVCAGVSVPVWVFREVDLYGGFRRFNLVFYVFVLCFYLGELQLLIADTLLRVAAQAEKLQFVAEARIVAEMEKVDDNASEMGRNGRSCESPFFRTPGVSFTMFERILKAEEFLNRVMEPFLRDVDPDMARIVASSQQVIDGLLEISTAPGRRSNPKRYAVAYFRGLGWLLERTSPPYLSWARTWANARAAVREDEDDDFQPDFWSVLVVQQHALILRISRSCLLDVVMTTFFQQRLDHPAHVQHWESLLVASDVQRSQLPLHTKRFWQSQAMLDLIIFGLLIAIIEATLALNQISGINDVESFGQLLALLLGVAGLGNIVYTKVFNIRYEISETEKKPERSEFDEAVEYYMKWKRYRARKAEITEARRSSTRRRTN